MEAYDIPDDPNLLHHLNSASGYLELAMPHEAYEEIRQIEPGYHSLPAVLHVELMALICLERYDEAAPLAGHAVRCYPEMPEFYVHGGAALSALNRGEEARALWNSAPAQMRETGYYHFNLAWCELQMGDKDKASDHLNQAVRLDPQIQNFAGDDPEMRELLGAGRASVAF